MTDMMERDLARDKAREAHRTRVAEAETHWQRTQRANERADTCRNFGRNAINTFRHRQRSRMEVALAKVDGMAGRAEDALARAVADHRTEFVSGEPLDEATLTRLASLWAATRPDFAAELRRIFEAGAGGQLSTLTEDEVRKRLATAREHEAAIGAAVDRARDLKRAVSGARQSIELEDRPEIAEVERLADLAEQAAQEAEVARDHLREALGLELVR